MAKLKAIFLNCTLKKSPEISNTGALIDKVVAEYKKLGVDTEVVRVADHNIPFGINTDEGKGDDWPKIYKKVQAANILIIASPIWFGVRGSITQMVMERLMGSYADKKAQNGQYGLYNKVAGVIVTGNEDGAHNVASNTLFNLTHLGATVPPNADCYWVGDAGFGPSYIELGQKHLYTNRTLRYLAHNTTWMANLLVNNPNPTNLKDLDEQAKKVSKTTEPNKQK